MPLTRPGSLAPVAPVPDKPFRRLFVGAWLLLFVGLGLLGVAVSRIGGVCAFVPCEPLVGSIGFVGVDGQVAIVVGERSAPDVTTVQVLGGDDPDAADAPVLWEIERVRPAVLDDPIVVGEVPAGFRQTIPAHGSYVRSATGASSELSGVHADNGCVFGVTPWPDAAPADGQVESWGTVSSREVFDRDDAGFTPCFDEARAESAKPIAIGGGFAIVAACALFIGISPARGRWRDQLLAGQRAVRSPSRQDGSDGRRRPDAGPNFRA